MIGRIRKNRPEPRRGAAVVEMAIVLPVFLTFLFGLYEFGHAYMVINALKAAANNAARLGVVQGMTTAQVEARVREKLSGAFNTDNVTVYVKNATIFDSPEVDPTQINYDQLPDIALSEAEPRQLFIVRVEVPYDDVAVVIPGYINGLILSGQSVMRHE